MKILLTVSVILLLLVLAIGIIPTQTRAGTPDDSYKPERYYISTNADDQQTNETTTYDDALTLNFTPPSSKDFLVIASALTNNSSTTNSTIVHLLLGPTGSETSYSETYHLPANAAVNWRGFGTHKVISTTGGTPYTAIIQFKTEHSDHTAYIKRCAITVLEVSNYYNSESNGESFGTHTVYTNPSANKTTLSFKPPSEADYIIFATANTYSTDDAKNCRSQITINGVSDTEIRTQSTVYASWGYMEKETLTDTTYYFTMQYRADAGGGNTAYIKDARVTAVLATNLGDNQYAEDEGETKDATGSYQNKASINFSPTTRNDYIIIGQCLGKNEASGNAFYANLDVDDTSYGEYVFEATSKLLYRSFFILSKVNLTAGEHDIRLQFKTGTAGAGTEAYCENGNLIAIKANTVESYSSSGHTTIDDSYSGSETDAYVWAHGLRASTNYMVAYYDAGASGGQSQGTDTKASGTLGNLSSTWDLTSNQSATGDGYWHAAIFEDESSPPANYSAAAGTAGYVTNDSFYVDAATIPEFPALIISIMVSGMCAGIYYWMRKRRLGHVKG